MCKSLLIFLLIFFSLNIRTDFFALRKLIHHEGNKIVYLLYDLHASIPADTTLADKLKDDVYKYMSENILQWKLFKPWENNQEIKNILASYVNNLPNLINQKQDLLTIIAKYRVSLINEDWLPYDADEDLIRGKLISSGLRIKFLVKYLGLKGGDGSYRTYVTPMSGMGEKLSGIFSSKELILLVNGGYYYNADERKGDGLSGGTDQAQKLVDRSTIEMIKKLFEDYAQKVVIVSEGFSHIQNIAAELVKQGYQAYPLIISEDLQARRLASTRLDLILKDIEFNTETTKGLINSEIEFSLVAKPIDLKVTLMPELDDLGICIECESKIGEISGVDELKFTPELESKLSYETGILTNLVKLEQLLYNSFIAYDNFFNLDLEHKFELLIKSINLVKLEKSIHENSVTYNDLINLDLKHKVDLVVKS